MPFNCNYSFIAQCLRLNSQVHIIFNPEFVCQYLTMQFDLDCTAMRFKRKHLLKICYFKRNFQYLTTITKPFPTDTNLDLLNFHQEINIPSIWEMTSVTTTSRRIKPADRLLNTWFLRLAILNYQNLLFGLVPNAW